MRLLAMKYCFKYIRHTLPVVRMSHISNLLLLGPVSFNSVLYYGNGENTIRFKDHHIGTVTVPSTVVSGAGRCHVFCTELAFTSH